MVLITFFFSIGLASSFGFTSSTFGLASTFGWSTSTFGLSSSSTLYNNT
jgi:hypothetical protein